jgi:hypothetical protein
MALQFYKIARGTVSPQEIKAQHERLAAQNEELRLGQERLTALNGELSERLLPVAKALEDREAGLSAQNQRQRARAILQEADTLIASIGQRMTPENFVYVGFANMLTGDFETAIRCLRQGLEEGVGEPLAHRAREALASLSQIQANEAIRRGASNHAP